MTVDCICIIYRVAKKTRNITTGNFNHHTHNKYMIVKMAKYMIVKMACEQGCCCEWFQQGASNVVHCTQLVYIIKIFNNLLFILLWEIYMICASWFLWRWNYLKRAFKNTLVWLSEPFWENYMTEANIFEKLSHKMALRTILDKLHDPFCPLGPYWFCWMHFFEK